MNNRHTRGKNRRICGQRVSVRTAGLDKLAHGMKMLLKGGQIRRESSCIYSLKSQSDTKVWHMVEWRGKSWRCDCANTKGTDNKKNDGSTGSSNCEHVDALMLFLSLPQILMQNLNPDNQCCPNCSAPFENANASGIQKNKSGLVQRYECQICGYRFNSRDGFSKLKSNPALIVAATDLFLRGLSSREVEGHLQEVYGQIVDHSTVHRWVSRYMKVLAKVEQEIIANNKISVGDKWHIDEVKIKVGGRMAFVWNLLDYETRYLLACYVSRSRGSNIAEKVINLAVKRFGKLPRKIVSDGLKSYIAPISRLNLRDGTLKSKSVSVRHIAGSTFKDKVNNNVLERYNKTLRRRVRVAEKFETINSANSFAVGYSAYYNLLRPSMALSAKRPIQKVMQSSPQTLKDLLVIPNRYDRHHRRHQR